MGIFSGRKKNPDGIIHSINAKHLLNFEVEPKVSELLDKMTMTSSTINTFYRNENVTISFQTIQDIQDKYKTIENWKKNRAPDNVRVKQIALQYTDNDKVYLVDGIMSAWNPKGTDILYIYDGIHRYLASKEFPKNLVLIKIISSDNEDLVIQDFKKINKSVSIPYLFLEDKNELKITVCNSVMELIAEQWPNNQSPSRKPWPCNYNRDTFMENVLSQLKIDFTLPNIDKLLFEALLVTNQYAKKYTIDNQIKTYKKSEITGFYLTYVGWNSLKYKIEQCIKNL